MVVDRKTLILIGAIAMAFLTGFVLHSLIIPPVRQPAMQVVFTQQAPEPIGPYSQAVKSGDFVFISGQIGIDPVSGNLSAAVDTQTVQALENIRAILAESGLDFSDVVQTRIYLTDLGDFTTVNGISEQYFKSPYPARATVQVAGLPKGARVEIEMLARAR